MSIENEAVAQDSDGDTPVAFAEFLTSTPPGRWQAIDNLVTPARSTADFYLNLPQIRLHCSSELCGGERIFKAETDPLSIRLSSRAAFLNYICANCSSTRKLFSLLLMRVGDNGTDGKAYKIGEFPSFGPPTPARLTSLIGPDRELFIKGRRCENQGLGIGAYAYYRRVVEQQKNRILGEVIRVSQRLDVDEEKIAILKNAQAEQQFAKAMDMVRSAVPPALLVNGHNPLTLLHSALSEGLHAHSDEACLDLAGTIRVVLMEFSDRLGQTMKDEDELRKAIGRLTAPKK